MIQAIPSTSTSVPVKRGSNLLNLLDSSPSTAHTSPPSLVEAPSDKTNLAHSHLPPKRVSSSLVRVKPEPLDFDIPRKRLSDIAFGSVDGNESNHHLSHPPYKKLKAESTLKEPFALVDRNTDSSENVVLPALPSSVEETRLQIAALQSQISSLQTALDRISYKRSKRQADMTRIARYTSDIRHLRQEKDNLSSSLPSANISPIKRTLSRHPLEGTFKPEPFMNFPFPPPSRNPVAQMPVASGSHVCLPSNIRLGSMDVDDDGISPPQVMACIRDVIPSLPQVRGADHFDENGDFHGRGRDLFVGPQAKADE